MAILMLNSPLAGWALPIEEVPDPAFAQRLAGDGMAIDPTGNTLHAPCAGEIVSIARTGHALALRSAGGVEILLHVGIDTVALAGQGFEALVTVGESVASGQALLRFDLDLIARRAPSPVTPMLVTAGGRVIGTTTQRLVAVGDPIMEIELDAAIAGDAGAPETSGTALSRRLAVRFEHGLHARPAAALVAALRPFSARVTVDAAGGSANARSAVALMSLGVQRDEFVEVSALGADAESALDAVETVLSALIPPAALPETAATTIAPPSQELEAVIASRGIALGPACFLRARRLEFAETALDQQRESARLQAAIAGVHARIGELLAPLQGPQRSILEAHAELVLDPELEERAQAHVATGSNAGHAWRLATEASAQALGRLGDARMRERVADLRDIEQQVLAFLAGDANPPATELPDDAILLADELLPSQLIGLDRRKLAGICTARGGPTSHVAIIAAALGIPALVAAGPRVLEIAAGSMLLLDAERGRLRLAPDSQEQARFAQALATRRARQAADLAAAGRHAQTVDGLQVQVGANLGAVDETAGAIANGADGCGLLRTEFLFLQRQSPPGEEEQFEQYAQIRDQLAPRPLTIRTMDVGGDKPIPYLPLPAEDNPALGLRGVRASLAQPQLLRSQLRAILQLESPASCRIMLPMVTDLGELLAVRAMLRECAEDLDIDVLPKLGAMVETPASALLAAQLLREADFLSIGTNDLSQYVLAMDRGHPLLAGRLDALHPAVLRLIGSVAAAGEASGRPVSVCGGLASDPDAIALLIGLGIRELSAVPATIPGIKRLVRSLDSRACASLAAQALELPDAAAVRRLVADWNATVAELETDR